MITDKIYKTQKDIFHNIYGHYNRLSFLTHKDFKNYPNEPFKKWFKIIEDCQGDIKQIYFIEPKILEYQSPENSLFELEMIGLHLIELNAYDFMLMQIHESISQITDKHEIAFLLKVLDEFQSEIEVNKGDRIITINALPEYIKDHVSLQSYNLILNSVYRINKRISEVKKSKVFGNYKLSI